MVQGNEYCRHQNNFIKCANSRCKINENILIYLHESKLDIGEKKAELSHIIIKPQDKNLKKKETTHIR
jgi:hypothetical protein